MSLLNVDLDVPQFPDAACIGTDPDLFYPDDSVVPKAAKAICASCPVRVACLQWALDRNDRYGVWGGLSGDERRELQRQAGIRACRVCHTPIPTGQQLCAPCRDKAYAARQTRYNRSVAA